MSAVQPLVSCKSTSAPASSRNSVVRSRPTRAADISAVPPSPPRIFTSIFASNNSRIMAYTLCPGPSSSFATIWSTVSPKQSVRRMLALASSSSFVTASFPASAAYMSGVRSKGPPFTSTLCWLTATKRCINDSRLWLLWHASVRIVIPLLKVVSALRSTSTFPVSNNRSRILQWPSVAAHNAGDVFSSSRISGSQP